MYIITVFYLLRYGLAQNHYLDKDKVKIEISISRIQLYFDNKNTKNKQLPMDQGQVVERIDCSI